MIAVSSGSPATTNERNVTISTSSAMITPTSSVRVTPGSLANSSPPSSACDPAGSSVASSAGQVLQGGQRPGREVGRLAVELHAHDRGPAVVGDRPAEVLVVGRARRRRRPSGRRARRRRPRPARGRPVARTSSATTTISAVAPLTWGNVPLSWSRARCDSVPGMVKALSSPAPSVPAPSPQSASTAIHAEHAPSPGPGRRRGRARRATTTRVLLGRFVQPGSCGYTNVSDTVMYPTRDVIHVRRPGRRARPRARKPPAAAAPGPACSTRPSTSSPSAASRGPRSS